MFIIKRLRMEDQLIDNTIRSYPEYSALEDPLVMILIGVIFTIGFGIWFARIMQLKILKFERESISPIPFKEFNTTTSWSGAFTGLTLFFCGMLQIFDFNSLKSLIASFIISSISGITMWRVIEDLVDQLDSGTVKEIDEYF